MNFFLDLMTLAYILPFLISIIVILIYFLDNILRYFSKPINILFIVMPLLICITIISTSNLTEKQMVGSLILAVMPSVFKYIYSMDNNSNINKANIDSNEPYEILGVRSTDHFKTIQKRYRKLLAKAHSKNQENQIIKIKSAYEEISSRFPNNKKSLSNNSYNLENNPVYEHEDRKKLKQEYINKYGSIEGLRQYYTHA